MRKTRKSKTSLFRRLSKVLGVAALVAVLLLCMTGCPEQNTPDNGTTPAQGDPTNATTLPPLQSATSDTTAVTTAEAPPAVTTTEAPPAATTTVASVGDFVYPAD